MRAFVTLLFCLAIAGSAEAKSFKQCNDIDELAYNVKVKNVSCGLGHRAIIDGYNGTESPFTCRKIKERAICKDGDRIVKWHYP